MAIPVTRQGIVASAILTLIGTWNEFLFAVIFTSKKCQNSNALGYGICNHTGGGLGKYGSSRQFDYHTGINLYYHNTETFSTGPYIRRSERIGGGQNETLRENAGEYSLFDGQKK